MNWNLLRAVVAVAKAGGVRKAARSLGISQPALSAQLKNLEEELGTPLFHRQGRTLALNQFGHRAVEAGHRLSHIYQSLQSEIRLASKGQQDRLNFAVERDLDRSYFVQVVGRILDRLPQRPHQVRIQAEFERPIAEDLQRGNIDFAFTSDAPEFIGLPAFATIPLKVEMVGTVRVRNQFFRGRERSTSVEGWKALAEGKIAILLPDTSSPLHNLTKKFLGDRGILNFKFLELWPLSAIVRGAAEELGVAFLPRAYLRREIQSRELESLLGPFDWGLRYHAYQSPLLATDTVKNVILEILKSEAH